MGLLSAGKAMVGRCSRIWSSFSPVLRELEDAKVLMARVLLQGRQGRAWSRRLSEVEFKVFSQLGDDGIIQYWSARPTCGAVLHRIRVGRLHRGEHPLPGAPRQLEGAVAGRRPGRRPGHPQGPDLLAARPARRLQRSSPGTTSRGCSGARVHRARSDSSASTSTATTTGSGNGSTTLADHRRAEYNAVFGPEAAVTVPYDPAFRRREAHSSGPLLGGIPRALCASGGRKGYVFVGGTSAGNNAYFVRKAWQSGLRASTLRRPGHAGGVERCARRGRPTHLPARRRETGGDQGPAGRGVARRRIAEAGRRGPRSGPPGGRPKHLPIPTAGIRRECLTWCRDLHDPAAPERGTFPPENP